MVSSARILEHRLDGEWVSMNGTTQPGPVVRPHIVPDNGGRDSAGAGVDHGLVLASDDPVSGQSWRNGPRAISSILAEWRDAERQLESAHEADDVPEVTRLAAQMASFADEYRAAFETVLARHGDRGTRPRADTRMAWPTAG